MRTILILCSVTLAVIFYWVYGMFQAPRHFGAEFTNAPVAQVAELLASPDSFIGKRLTLKGKVEDQCPTTGCFFYFSAGQKKLKIELGDLAQKIPKRIGAPVTVEGQLVPFGSEYQFLGTAAEFE